MKVEASSFTNKTTISVGILVLIIPIVFWAANVQAETQQNKADIIELDKQDEAMLKEMRELREVLNITNNNLTRVNTLLEQ